MTREGPELLTDIRDFTTQFYLTLRREVNDLQYGGLDLAIRDFALFKHRFLCKYRLLKRVSYLLIFVTRENEIFISANRDPLFFPFVNHTRDPPEQPLFIELRISHHASDL